MTSVGKAVVTGGAGFIGQALIRRLQAMDTEVVAIDLNPCPVGGVRSVQADAGEPGVLESYLGPESVVFHLAAHADVAASVANPRRDFENTFRPLFEVLESARRAGARVLFPSTASVFDLNSPMPLAETAPKRPSSPYGAAKLAGEAYCAAYHRAFGLDVRVARMFSVYGVGMRRFFIHDIVRKLQRSTDRLEILGDGMQVRDYLYIDDAVEGLLLIAAGGRAGEDYNLASGQPVVLLDLAREIAALVGSPDVRLAPTGQSFPGDTPRWYADITKAQSIGFAPSVPLAEGLRRTVAWLTR
jgi:UDP-glucose 4-epimerase